MDKFKNAEIKKLGVRDKKVGSYPLKDDKKVGRQYLYIQIEIQISYKRDNPCGQLSRVMCIHARVRAHTADAKRKNQLEQGAAPLTM